MQIRVFLLLNVHFGQRNQGKRIQGVEAGREDARFVGCEVVAAINAKAEATHAADFQFPFVLQVRLDDVHRLVDDGCSHWEVYIVGQHVTLNE